MSIQQQANQLLDFNQKFDVVLLDSVVACGLGGAVQGAEVWSNFRLSALLISEIIFSHARRYCLVC